MFTEFIDETIIKNIIFPTVLKASPICLAFSKAVIYSRTISDRK